MQAFLSHKTLCDVNELNQFTPLLKRLTRAGLHGAKSGRGFFVYDANRRRTDRLPDDKPRLT